MFYFLTHYDFKNFFFQIGNDLNDQINAYENIIDAFGSANAIIFRSGVVLATRHSRRNLNAPDIRWLLKMTGLEWIGLM